MSAYICPMHADVRMSGAGDCPICGMTLVAEDTRFPMLKHVASRPLHIAVMLAAMAVVMVAAMMLTR
jgi:hypothetical protein